MQIVRGTVVLALLCAQPLTAGAEDLMAAREHYKRGTTLYDLQRFAEAAREYELAFENKDDPVLLFNIAQAWRFAGEYQRAIGAYRSYLRRVPKAPNREEVEGRIVDIQRILDEQKKTQFAPPAGTLPTPDLRAPPGTPPPTATAPRPVESKPTVVATAPVASKPVEAKPVEAKPVEAKPVEKPVEAKPIATPPKPGRTKLYAGIAVAVVGVALLGAGGGMAAMAQSAKDEIDHPKMDWVFDPAVQDRAKTFDAVSFALLGVGAAALVGGTVLAVLGWREGKSAKRAQLTPLVGGGLTGASLQLDF